MKHVLRYAVLCFVIAIACQGCATRSLIDQAKPHYTEAPCDCEVKEWILVPGEKGAYAGLPFSIALDIATSPFLLLWMGYLKAIGFKG